MQVTALIGIVGCIAYYVLLHAAIPLYYKKFRYWSQFYCELERRLPENRRASIVYTIANASLPLSIFPFFYWLPAGFPYAAAVAVIDLVAVWCNILTSVFTSDRHVVAHSILSVLAIAGLVAMCILVNLTLQRPLTWVFVWAFFGFLCVLALSLLIRDRRRQKTVQVAGQRVVVLLLCLNLVQIYAGAL